MFSTTVKVALLLGVVVLCSDTVGSLAAGSRGFNYAYLAPINLLLYLAAGFLGAGGDWRYGVLAGGLVALIDATLGWAISSRIGVGVPAGGWTRHRVATTVVNVTAMGAGLGAIGAVIALFTGQKGAA
jgi:hypothetical protein